MMPHDEVKREENSVDDAMIIQRLLDANPLREPLLRRVIRALDLPEGSRGLDVGCGIGLQSLLLAEGVGEGGHVTAMDINPALLLYAEVLAAQAGLAHRITFREGDMRSMPFDDGMFDWVWSADCVGYPAGALSPLLQELMRMVRPGGKVILLAWSSQQVLPGYPFLEARLNAGCSAYMPFLVNQAPVAHFPRALGWLRKAGLVEVYAQTFVGDVQAPLRKSERTAMLSLLEMLWEQPQSKGSAREWKAFKRLCDPASPDFLLDRPDYYAFFTYTMFQGRLPFE